jgi:hypothetical protein
MNKNLRNFFILILPFLTMVLVNEIVRFNTKEKGYTYKGITAINSVSRTPTKCTWYCHNNTSYCRDNHVKILKPYFRLVDPVYFGIIKLLKSSGNYGLANIVFLVILWPLIMFILLTKSLNLYSKIRFLRQNAKA